MEFPLEEPGLVVSQVVTNKFPGSTTVTVLWQVLVLPLGSVTVSVTVFVPRSEVVKLLLDRPSDTSPQVSVEPSSTREASRVAVPPLPSWSVTAVLHCAVGGVVPPLSPVILKVSAARWGPAVQ